MRALCRPATRGFGFGCGASARDALAQQDPVARRDAEKLGDAPIVFPQFVDRASANAISTSFR